MTSPGQASVARFQQDIAAVPSSLVCVRHQLDRLLAGRSIPPARIQDVRLAVTEACANAVVHAYPKGEAGTMQVTADLTTKTLVVEVRDYGSGFGAHHPRIGAGMRQRGSDAADARSV